MKLNPRLMQSVIDDLRVHGAEVMVRVEAKIGRLWDFENRVDCTIRAEFPDGRLWDIIGIEEELTNGTTIKIY